MMSIRRGVAGVVGFGRCWGGDVSDCTTSAPHSGAQAGVLGGGAGCTACNLETAPKGTIQGGWATFAVLNGGGGIGWMRDE